MECSTMTYKIVCCGVLFAMMTNPFVGGVTFSTSTTGSGRTDDDSDGDTFTWVVGTTVTVTITTDAFAVSGTVSPVLVLQQTDTTSIISCILSVGDSSCSPTCIAGTVTCTKGNPSGILQVQFTLPSVPETYYGASLTFTLSGSTVGPWEYGSKQFIVSACSASAFNGAQIRRTTSASCGENCVASFKCNNENLQYQCGEFLRTCQIDTSWNDMTSICQVCNCVEPGHIAAMVFGIIDGIILIVWTGFAIARMVSLPKMPWRLLVYLVVAWAVYTFDMLILGLAVPECCCLGLSPGGIIGVVLGCFNTIYIIVLYIMFFKMYPAAEVGNK